MPNPLDGLDDITEEALGIVESAILDEHQLPSDEATLLARIPLMAGSEKKAAYLSYRSCGFPITQSADLAGVTLKTVHHWRKVDPVFKRIEQEDLAQLQESTGNDVIKIEFLRNMRLLLHADMKVISKGVNNINLLEEREYDYFKTIRRLYTPAELLSIEKILHPDKHHDGPVTIKLSWGNRQVDAQLEAPAIEATYKELPDGNSDSS